MSRFVDDHEVEVAAPAEAVWRSLGRHLAGASALTERYARAIGARPAQPRGDVLAAGGTIPGFAVEEAVPGKLLRLVGRHRFSTYELAFTLEEESGRTALRAHTDAEFPGLHGRLYRTAVIGSGAHRVLVRRMLRAIGRSAERSARG